MGWENRIGSKKEKRMKKKKKERKNVFREKEDNLYVVWLGVAMAEKLPL